MEMSDEHKEQLRKSHKGKKYKPMSDIGKYNISIAKRGVKFSEKAKKNMKRSPEFKLKVSLKMEGMRRSDEFKNKCRNKRVSDNFRKKQSELHQGEKSNFWKGGIYTHERKLFHRRAYRNRKLHANGSHLQEEWELLKAQYNWTCPSCHLREPGIKLTEDHIIPLSKGGSDNIENIQPLCKSCNCIKHDKIKRYERL